MASEQKSNPVTKEELTELVEELESIRGRHTELVTVYVPSDYNLNNVVSQLEGEKGTAKNIKSKTTQKNVIEALERIIRVLKLMGRTPKNGLAVFSGNVSETEGQTDIKLWVIEPPEEIGARLYRCDQVFVLDPLKDVLEHKEVYGLFVIDRQEATIGLLEGKKVKILRKLESGVPGKIKAGGQCLSPETLIETRNKIKQIADIEIGEELKSVDLKNKKITFTKCLNKWQKKKEEYLQIIFKDYFSISSSLEHTFFKEYNNQFIEIFAKDLVKGDFLIINHSNSLDTLKIIDIIKINKPVNMIDIETEAGNFIANGILVHNSANRFARIIEGKARDFFKKCAVALKDCFFDMKNLKGIIIGGPMPTKDDFLRDGGLVTALKEKVIGMKDIGYSNEHGIDLLVESSQDILEQQEIMREKKLLENFFNMLGKYKNKTAYGSGPVKKALDMAAAEKILISKKLPKSEAREFIQKANSTGASVEFVSVETEEGEQFWNLSGIGAILRYSLT